MSQTKEYSIARYAVIVLLQALQGRALDEVGEAYKDCGCGLGILREKRLLQNRAL
jgi:hypothetical protein